VPTYEYECSSCDTTHEVVQKMTDATLTECPECGHSPIRKLFTGVGVVFKGSGFYRTDSRASGESSSSGSSATIPAKSESKKSDSSSSTSSTTSTATSAPVKTESKKPTATT